MISLNFLIAMRLDWIVERFSRSLLAKPGPIVEMWVKSILCGVKLTLTDIALAHEEVQLHQHYAHDHG
jgi:hypothetical protein